MNTNLCTTGQPEIVIGGLPHDTDLIEYLAEELGAAGMAVWFLQGNTHNISDKRTVAETVMGAKVYVVVLSEGSVTSQALKDEVALAYISNTVICPVGRAHYRKLAPHVDGGMKLMLARIQWVFFTKEEHYAERVALLLRGIRTQLNRPPENDNETSPEFASGTFQHFPTEYTPESSEENMDDTKELQFDTSFWERHFGDDSEASWNSFRAAFYSDYSEELARSFGEDRVKFFENLIYRDIFDLHKSITKEKYEQFLGVEPSTSGNHFYARLCAFAQGSQAMKEVFDMDSTVRLIAIQNLGSFNTPSVIRQLLSLIKDSDPNIQAVAALALAKTGHRYKRTEDLLIGMMKNKDRLVRESACLSLAHMKSERATQHIIKLWRNDPIKHVREAAELALSRSGSLKAEEAMKVTTVLTSELQRLRSLSKRAETS